MLHFNRDLFVYLKFHLIVNFKDFIKVLNVFFFLKTKKKALILFHSKQV